MLDSDSVNILYMIVSALFNSEKIDNGVIVKLTVKQLHMYHIPDFKEDVEELLAEKPENVIFVLSKVQYLDSSAMGVMFQLQKAIDAYDGNMILVGINHTIEMVFKLTRSDQHFSIYPDLDTALSDI